MEPDFSGYATKAGIRCTDGRTITAEAFKHMDGMQVPLVWMHGHNDIKNVLGHVILEAKHDGMVCHGFFDRETDQGKNGYSLVKNKHVKFLSIYANQLVEKPMGSKDKSVLHGEICEVSLVLKGANPKAMIDQVRIRHAGTDEVTELEDEAIIHTGIVIGDLDGTVVDGKYVPAKTEEKPEAVVEHAAGGKTLKDIYDSMSSEQKDAVQIMLTQMHDMTKTGSLAQSGTNPDEGGTEDNKPKDEDNLEHKEGADVRRRVFENNGGTGGNGGGTENDKVLTNAEFKALAHSAIKSGANSLKAVLEEVASQKGALQHGVTNIDLLFPDFKTWQNTPEFDKRDTTWVDGVLAGVHRTPYTRLRSMVADLTQDAARAKGYTKGEYKKEEWFAVTRRTTGPTTIYKKQKFDRDDVIDITDFDFLAWIKMEMRVMLDEEIAVAILIGDGREIDDDDKIADPAGAQDGNGVRSITAEHEMYATTINVNIDDANSSYVEVIEDIIRARKFYKGTGTPTLYTTVDHLTAMLLLKDADGRRFYRSVADLALELRVRDIVEVEPMEGRADLVGVLVNLADYNVGTDRGGEVNWFDDFDIDYNKMIYLAETRISGMLMKIKSAIIIKKVASNLVVVKPQKPAFVASTGVITIPSQTGVVYKDTTAAGSTISAGAMSALSAGATKHIVAVPASGYYFPDNATDEWDFTRDAA